MIENKIGVKLKCIKEVDEYTAPISSGDLVEIIQDGSRCPFIKVNGNVKLATKVVGRSGCFVLSDDYITDKFFKPFDELKELREGITVKEVNTLADGLPTAQEAGEAMQKVLNPEGYMVAEVERILDLAVIADQADGPNDMYTIAGVARRATPKLKALFDMGTFDEAAKEALQGQVEDGLERIKEMQTSGVEMQRKLNEEKDARLKDLNALTESETNLETALQANKDLHSALLRNSERSDKLLDILINVSANK